MTLAHVVSCPCQVTLKESKKTMKAFGFIVLSIVLSACSTDLSSYSDTLEKCTKDRDCSFGMVCAERKCVDRSLEGGKGADPQSFLQGLHDEAATLDKNTQQCSQEEACATEGKCQGTPEGLCIVATQEHCENARITCSQKGRCIYVPRKYACCTSANGEECEPFTQR